MLSCRGKRTRFQPSEDRWRCPICGGEIVIEWIEDGADFGCDRLHEDDIVEHKVCGESWFGKTISKRIFQASKYG